MRRVFARLWKSRSQQFHVAFAEAFECIAFTAARWVDRRTERLFQDADAVPASLFLWHLAEEAQYSRSCPYPQSSKSLR